MRTHTLLQHKTTVASLTLLFIAVPFAIKFQVIPPSPYTNFLALLTCTLICLYITRREKWKREHYDYRTTEKKKLKVYAIAYTVFTFVGILFLLVMKELLDLRLNLQIIQKKEFLLCVVPVCFLQVLSYRVFLLRKLETLTTSQKELIAINTILFAIMHVMFSWQFFVICIFAGVGFACMYQYFRNAVFMLVSQTILNICGALAGFFETSHG
jgi:hypothetical protein